MSLKELHTQHEWTEEPVDHVDAQSRIIADKVMQTLITLEAQIPCCADLTYNGKPTLLARSRFDEVMNRLSKAADEGLS